MVKRGNTRRKRRGELGLHKAGRVDLKGKGGGRQHDRERGTAGRGGNREDSWNRKCRIT